jgi:hypothetical protein
VNAVSAKRRCIAQGERRAASAGWAAGCAQSSAPLPDCQLGNVLNPGCKARSEVHVHACTWMSTELEQA